MHGDCFNKLLDSVANDEGDLCVTLMLGIRDTGVSWQISVNRRFPPRSFCFPKN